MMQGSLQDQLLDIYGMWHTPWWQTTTFYCVVGMFGVLCVGLILVRACMYWRAKKKIVTPWDTALMRLEQARRECMTAQQSKMFYEYVIMVLKQYLHARFGFDIMGKTDQEVLDYLANNGASTELVESLRNIMLGSALVRFANQQAVQQHMEHDFALAVTVVKNTVPVQKK